MKTRKLMKKSKTATKIEDIGMINRGKYIFFIICAFEIMLFPALVIPEEKTSQRINPEKTKT